MKPIGETARILVARSARRQTAATVRAVGLCLGAGTLMAGCDNNWQPLCTHECFAGGGSESIGAGAVPIPGGV